MDNVNNNVNMQIVQQLKTEGLIRWCIHSMNTTQLSTGINMIVVNARISQKQQTKKTTHGRGQVMEPITGNIVLVQSVAQLAQQFKIKLLTHLAGKKLMERIVNIFVHLQIADTFKKQNHIRWCIHNMNTTQRITGINMIAVNANTSQKQQIMKLMIGNGHGMERNTINTAKVMGIHVQRQKVMKIIHWYG